MMTTHFPHRNSKHRQKHEANLGWYRSDFAATATPGKWKGGGVIIAQKTRFSFDKDANKLAVYEITRRRIKLNDRDAINSYSTVYFRIGSSNDGAGIKIIKANGTVQDVAAQCRVHWRQW